MNNGAAAARTIIACSWVLVSLLVPTYFVVKQ
ncbi:hypothetical protein J2T17_006741 [Paenibacillus mucilaginosus]